MRYKATRWVTSIGLLIGKQYQGTQRNRCELYNISFSIKLMLRSVHLEIMETLWNVDGTLRATEPRTALIVG